MLPSLYPISDHSHRNKRSLPTKLVRFIIIIRRNVTESFSFTFLIFETLSINYVNINYFTDNPENSELSTSSKEDTSSSDNKSYQNAAAESSFPGKDSSPSSVLADSWEDAVDPKLGSPIKNVLYDDDDEDKEQNDILPELEKTKIRKKALDECVDKVKKEHVNLVIIGHVGRCRIDNLYSFRSSRSTSDKFLSADAGKSTIGGQIMALTGMVDKRTLEKYEREAKERSRESWYLSWVVDTNQEGLI